MDNLRAIVKNLFCYIFPEDILNGKVTYDNIDENTFKKLGNSYIERYTNDELGNMFRLWKEEFAWHKNKLMSENPHWNDMHNISDKLNVFDALVAFDFNILIEENGQPVCQYQHLLRWRDMITVLDEDMFTTSYLAMHDIVYARNRNNFFWRPVIGHNNFALNKLVSKGVAENHFHLKGSAPTFNLSWISMMNDIVNPKFVEILKRYEENRLQKNIDYGGSNVRLDLVIMWRVAALIRLALFAKLKEKNLSFTSMRVGINEVYDICNNKSNLDIIAYMNDKQHIGKTIELGENVHFKRNYVEVHVESNGKTVRFECPDNEYEKLCKKYAEKHINRMIMDYDLLDEYLIEIQSNIDELKGEVYNSEYDYTICEASLGKNNNNNLNEIISGERWLMYSMFRYVYLKKSDWENYFNLFYLYLVIKTNIRREIVQTNKNVGFDNFSLYQDRKEDFIDKTIYERPYIRMAVKDTIYNQHIKFLEARIAPKDTPNEIMKSIKKYENAICYGLNDEEKNELKKKYFYVVHFIKGKEDYHNENCRHFNMRGNVKRQALALAEYKKNGMEGYERIRGIDAASSEIGCRPEVFASAFRYLKNSNGTGSTYPLYDHIKVCKDLMATYHVGEDFLDITDGLRAIDEAIAFLNLRCGDRLGHALALGVDIDDWYQKKAYRIVLPKQDYLDNLVWLYARIRNYNIDGCDDAKAYIEKRFAEFFREIYTDNMTSNMLKDIEAAANTFYKKNKINNSYHCDNMHTGINEYYDAWKLRGDEPEHYKNGFFEADILKEEEWDYYSINRNYPVNYRIRYSPEICIIYYMYHFNLKTKAIGSQVVEARVNDSIVHAVKEVRKAMQREIANMGIGIETNPSSNYLIGTFRRYDRHPIVNWYNLGLTYNPAELNNCPQLQVSINTDDQGVFYTYLENEYAYLALALEKAKSEDGNSIYNRTMILQWLDNIRKMGIDQSFVDN